MKLWHASVEDGRPVLVDCPDGRWPAKDARGHPVCRNTHFDTEAEAWENLMAEVSAGVSLAGGAVEYAEGQLRKMQQRAGEAAKRFAHVSDNHDAWKREQKR